MLLSPFSLLFFFPQLLEERPEQFPTLPFAAASGDIRPMAVRKQIHGCPAASGTFVIRPIDYPVYMGVDHRTSTHGTWLQSHIELTPGQSPGTQVLAGLGNGFHLRVSQGVFSRLTTISPFSQNLPILDYLSSYRHLSL